MLRLLHIPWGFQTAFVGCSVGLRGFAGPRSAVCVKCSDAVPIPSQDQESTEQGMPRLNVLIGNSLALSRLHHL